MRRQAFDHARQEFQLEIERTKATSGGEGAALLHERDQFHAALVREFGYDPTEGAR